MSAGGGMAYETEENKTSAFDDIVSSAQNNSRGAAGSEPRPSGVQDVKIIMWGNGF